VLAGQLLLPAGGEPEDFTLKLWIDAAAGPTSAEPEQAQLAEDGGFRFAPCEPGRARLALAYGRTAVYEQGGIELTAGETTDLGQLDLRAALHTLELTFSLANGEPVREGALIVREPDGVLSLWLSIGNTGRVRFLARRPSVDLWAAGRGASATLFQGVTDGQDLRLAPAAEARLRLAPGCTPPEAPLALIVRGERLLPETIECAALNAFQTEGTVEPDGSARLQVPCTGTYELAWFVLRTDTGVEFAVEQAEPQTVEVTEPPAPVIAVSLSAEALAAAVAEAGG
jgi:hypothetical protein